MATTLPDAPLQPEFTPEGLVAAIRALFEQNQYEVEGPIQISGAEIDLKARAKQAFSQPIYIEATIEHVDNDKYGKDVGKLALVDKLNPGTHRLIVSARGFSLPVKERATATGIETLTYAELFSRFENFSPYVSAVTNDGALAVELQELDRIYEEPFLEDRLGQDAATEFLDSWLASGSNSKWLIIVGEYGTGKTALTKILQYRWTKAYEADTSRPIPFRIELRDFVRQFDAAGLIHRFLDTNRLGHVPIDFVMSLLRSGRVVLLLDGYDEMAQFLNARERRACLEALAELASEGARGILTSRPNYFTEAEELQVFEVLYSSLERGSFGITRRAQELLAAERRLDDLLEAYFLERFERVLRDLTEEQTMSLVERRLKDDPAGKRAVLRLLKRVFRAHDEGASASLSGKPVIIAYLLEIVEQLKTRPDDEREIPLTEWMIYRLIINELMLRDFDRTPRIVPDKRRAFLQELSVYLSQRDQASISEEEFRRLIRSHFNIELRRVFAGEREREVDSLFQDLRGSATLTRSTDPARPGWRFSHNSLREYLLAETMVHSLRNGRVLNTQVPITDLMKIFARSLSGGSIRRLFEHLARLWPERRANYGAGQTLAFLWDAALSLFSSADDPSNAMLSALSGAGVALDGVTLNRIVFSSEHQPARLQGASFEESELSDVGLAFADLQRTRFTNTILENVNLSSANLSDSNFSGSVLIDVDFTDATLKGVDFRGIDPSASILVEDESGRLPRRRLVGDDALGWLRFSGGMTEDVEPYLVYVHHPKFAIVSKILTKLSEQRTRQRRGLVQRGAAQRDVAFARRIVQELEQQRLLASRRGGELIEVTPAGREMLTRFVERRELPAAIAELLAEQ